MIDELNRNVLKLNKAEYLLVRKVRLNDLHPQFDAEDPATIPDVAWWVKLVILFECPAHPH
jgi:hypothetical protein